MKDIIYKLNKEIEIEKIIALLFDSDYLPIEDMNDKIRLQKMFTNANLIVSAWDNTKLVGIARSLCDFSYCCYLSDLCVDLQYRNLNIGKKLIELTKESAGNECKLILHSNANAFKFYEKIGMKNISEAFIIQRNY
ncbi:GNAT family N-acetyltransferase [Chryseobacterium sp. PTM-20240506]|uniref:GNAT family N-acetyltransferase n=1 Tax=unclassified Chryseobacterium TaxID=2593645 RepID=UPI00235969E2|nr:MULTISPECIES: GNAT family N-acetyltransferase [unclassified Chryseobacterium]MDC8104097.1 GNAT family N-acetyltransferase [Chryseobacterium sp. B21-037]MDQ1803705.1 GNAT family N-acetyltransferase [Chryseobacterium sp. CKR4-1]